MCWPWSTPLPTPKNPARCLRCARLRGGRLETGAPGRAERPSKWWGSVLGHLASWHDRGPGGRYDDGARSRGRGHPRPQTGLDRKWLKNETLLYNIGVSTLSTHNNLWPSTERCERRASRASLALVDELTGWIAASSHCRWPWSTSSPARSPGVPCQLARPRLR